MVTAIDRKKVSIWIEAADTAASSLASTDIIEGEIRSYSKSGGETDVESEPLFGGFIDKEQPREQIELEFEIVPSLVAGSIDRWDAMAYAEDVTNAGIYTTAGTTSTQPGSKAVFIQAYDSTASTYKSFAFNNASVTVSDMEHSADDVRSYNLTLKLSPETTDGVANLMTSDIAITALPAWSALDNN